MESKSTQLKVEAMSDDKSAPKVSMEVLLNKNQLRYVLPKDSCLVNRRTVAKNYPQTQAYNPSQIISFVLNSGDMFVKGRTSWLSFQLGIDTGTDTPTYDVRLGSAGAISVINRIQTTHQSGTMISDVQYANVWGETNIHYTNSEQYLKTQGYNMGLLDVPSYRAYGLVKFNGDGTSASVVNTIATTFSPPGPVATNMTSIASRTTSSTTPEPITTSAISLTGTTSVTATVMADGKGAYQGSSMAPGGNYSGIETNYITGSVNTTASPVTYSVNSTGGLATGATTSTCSVAYSGSQVGRDPSLSFYGTQIIGSSATTPVSASITPTTIDTSIDRKWIGRSILYNSTCTSGAYPTTAPTFCIPLSQLYPFWDSDKLIPPQVVSSLRIDITLEAAATALVASGSITATPTYTLTNPIMYLDSYQISDEYNSKLIKISAESGLAYVFSDISNTVLTTPSSTSGEQIIDNKTQASRAELIFVKPRRNDSITNISYDSLCSVMWPLAPASSSPTLQFNIGSLYIPNDKITDIYTCYQTALWSLSMMDEYRDEDDFRSVTFQDFLFDKGIMACTLERNHLIALSGMPIASSRVMVARFTPRQLPYAVRYDMFLRYSILLTVYNTKVVRRQ